VSKRNRKTRRVTSPPAIPPATEAARTSYRPAIAVIALALIARLAHLSQMRASPFFSVLLGDSLAYDAWAQRLSQGGWLESEVFYQAPLYPYLLGALYAVAGRDLLLVRLVQAILGSIACGLLCVAGIKWFGRRAGVACGVILALYGPALFFDGLIQKSVVDVFIITAIVLLLALTLERRSFLTTAALGIALGCVALTRENTIVFIPVILAWLAWRGRDWVPHAAAVLAGVLLVLAPVALHNRQAGGAWVLTTSQFGPNLYIGNSDTATGTYVPLVPTRGNAAFERQDATELAARAMGRTPSPAEVSAYWRGRALAWIRAHPADWLRLTVFKLRLAANRGEATDTEALPAHAEHSWPLRVSSQVLNFGLLAPMAFLGIWITRDRWRELWVLYALAAAYTLTIALFYVLDRYRYPLVPFLALFAGAAIAGAVTWWRTSSPSDKRGGLLGVGLVAIACNWPIPLLSADTARALTHFNLGNALRDAGRADEAIVEYRAAAGLLPSHAQTHSNLGAALAARGEQDAAIREYREAIRLDPALAKTRNNLGIALASAGRLDEAMTEFDKAVTLDPASAEARFNRGTTLAAQGHVEAAIAELGAALRLDPSRADAHINLGVLLAQTDRLPAAIEQFQAALRLDPGSASARANLARAQALANARR